MGDAGRHGNEPAGTDRDRLVFGADLEGELPGENVEGLRVLVDV